MSSGDTGDTGDTDRAIPELRVCDLSVSPPSNLSSGSEFGASILRGGQDTPPNPMAWSVTSSRPSSAAALAALAARRPAPAADERGAFSGESPMSRPLPARSGAAARGTGAARSAGAAQ